jgi:hypothetical protein
MGEPSKAEYFASACMSMKILMIIGIYLSICSITQNGEICSSFGAYGTIPIGIWSVKVWHVFATQEFESLMGSDVRKASRRVIPNSST